MTKKKVVRKVVKKGQISPQHATKLHKKRRKRRRIKKSVLIGFAAIVIAIVAIFRVYSGFLDQLHDPTCGEN